MAPSRDHYSSTGVHGCFGHASFLLTLPPALETKRVAGLSWLYLLYATKKFTPCWGNPSRAASPGFCTAGRTPLSIWPKTQGSGESGKTLILGLCLAQDTRKWRIPTTQRLQWKSLQWSFLYFLIASLSFFLILSKQLQSNSV